jgi:4-hydroxy-3-methylbut-2-enyl diphosphate reductase
VKISLAENAGHCFGVKAAIQKAFETARREDHPIYTLGPLIHNPQVVQKLEKEGVKAVNDLSLIQEGVIIIRSHGVAPEVIEQARKQGLTVIDATCPFVQRAHKLARELVDQGYPLVILGDAAHPEVEGILGTVKGAAHVVSGPEEIPILPPENRYGLIAQTTQSLENLQRVASALLTRTGVLKVINTICNATTDLQRETRSLAQNVDFMLVVGGRNSANTSRLVSICEEAGVRTRHIEIADEIKPEWLDADVHHVGVTAGTSTPDWIIAEIIARLESLGGEESTSD